MDSLRVNPHLNVLDGTRKHGTLMNQSVCLNQGIHCIQSRSCLYSVIQSFFAVSEWFLGSIIESL